MIPSNLIMLMGWSCQAGFVTTPIFCVIYIIIQCRLRHILYSVMVSSYSAHLCWNWLYIYIKYSTHLCHLSLYVYIYIMYIYIYIIHTYTHTHTYIYNYTSTSSVCPCDWKDMKDFLICTSINPWKLQNEIEKRRMLEDTNWYLWCDWTSNNPANKALI